MNGQPHTYLLNGKVCMQLKYDAYVSILNLSV